MYILKVTLVEEVGINNSALCLLSEIKSESFFFYSKRNSAVYIPLLFISAYLDLSHDVTLQFTQKAYVQKGSQLEVNSYLKLATRGQVR